MIKRHLVWRIRMPMLLVGLMPVLLIALSFRQSMRSRVRASAEAQLTAQANTADAQIEGFINEYVHLLRSAENTPHVRSMNAAAATQVLRGLGLGDNATFLRVVDLSGSDVARSNEGKFLTGLNDRNWFKKAVSGKDLAYETIISRTTGRPSLAVAVPIRRDGAIVGVLESAIDMERVNKVVSGVKPGGKGFAWLVDENNHAMVVRDSEKVARQASLADHPAVVAARAANGGGVTTFEEDGQSWIARYQVLPQGWVLVLQQPESEAFAAMARLDVELLLAALLALVAVGLLSFWLSRSITRPISVMVGAAQRIARGDVRETVAYTAEDELGELAEALRETISATAALSESARRVAAGETDVEVEPRCEHDVLSQALLTLTDVNARVQNEVRQLTAAAQAGHLAVRADASGFQGEFRTLVEGVNCTLDTVVAPVEEAIEVLGRVAGRDLSARMQGSYQGDFARMEEELNRAVENLDVALSETAATADQVSSASGQIASGSQALAEGASEQASSLEEVSSSLQELSSMSRQNSASAHEARSLTQQASESASTGASRMGDLSVAMERIKESAGATARIVKTIDEIAFQTNLLALNAAVEAARAGDAGKGFAVVAEEVRSLAQRSAEAAKNTASLIEEAVKNTEGGVSLNLEVAAQLREIVGRVQKVGEVMQEIAAASDQQTQGVAEITTAVEQMNAVTQQVAATSEEGASAAEELSSQAEHLKEVVGGFVLSESSTHTGRAWVVAAEPAAAHVHGRTPACPAQGSRKPHGNGKNRVAAQLIPFGEDERALAEF